MIAELKEKLEKKVTERDLLVSQMADFKKDVEDLLTHLENLEEARIILQKSAQITQKQLSFHIENIVSHALAAVFDEPYEFKVNFVTRRNYAECDLVFVDENGTEMKPLDSCGYGAADVASLALRVAYWNLSEGVRNTLILDEPIRNLDKTKHPLAAMMIKELSTSLNLQFLIITHNSKLSELADVAFEVTKNFNGSHIREITS